MNAANGGARVLIGSGGYCACVEHHDFGRNSINGALQAAIEQLPLDGRAIGLRRAAAKVLHVIGRHKLIITTGHLASFLHAILEWVYDQVNRWQNSRDRIVRSATLDAAAASDLDAVSGSVRFGVPHETSHSVS